jgi:hypothetical protein
VPRPGLFLLALALAAARPARAASDTLILGTHDPALASALSVAVSPRGLSIVELEEPFRAAAEVEAARREIAARDAVAAVWLCDDAAGAHALCFCARDGRFVVRPVSVASPLAPPDAAALALSVKVLLGPASTPAPPAPNAPLPRPVTRAASPEAQRPPSTPAVVGRVALGASLSVLPLGTIARGGTSPAGTFPDGGDAATATAVSAFLQYSLRSWVSLGLSPQITFNVKPSGASSSATEYDLRARVTFWKGVSPRLVGFARLAIGYSIVALPDAWTSTFAGASLGMDKGWLLGASAGVEYLVSPAAFLILEGGYQAGFQGAVLTSGGARYELDLATRYPHVGLGFGVTLGQ